MNSPDEQALRTPRERMSALGAAVLRVAARLSLDTVSVEVADARPAPGRHRTDRQSEHSNDPVAAPSDRPGTPGVDYTAPVRRVRRSRREPQIRRPRTRTVVRVLAHAGAIVLLYLAFSLALALGLQVESLYGNIGLAVTAVLVAAYVYFGFIRKKKATATHRPPHSARSSRDGSDERWQ